MKVCAVVVTYNRPDLLKRCVERLLAQTHRPSVLVVDNASETPASRSLAAFGEAVRVIRLPENTGGAGGFHLGLREAFRLGHEAAWLMDDDGLPGPDCLEKLIEAVAGGLDVAGPLVLDESDEAKLAFPRRRGNETNALASDFMASADGGVVDGAANFFNGTLIKRSAYEKVGDIKFECFVWGDETDYFLRCKKSGMVGTVIAARYRHPADSMRSISNGPFGRIVVGKPERAHILYRNLGYTDRVHRGLPAWSMPIRYLLYFLPRMRFREAAKFLRYYFDGRKDAFALAPSRAELVARLELAFYAECGSVHQDAMSKFSMPSPRRSNSVP